MGTKTIALMVVSVLTLMSETFGAKIPEFCAVPPVQGFYGSKYQKWGFFAKENKCSQFTWGGRNGNDNHFDTELECLKTCRPGLLLKVEEKYDIVAGQCICRCPKCNHEPITTTTPITTAKIPVTQMHHTTNKPVTRMSIPTTTEKATTKSWFLNLFG